MRSSINLVKFNYSSKKILEISSIVRESFNKAVSCWEFFYLELRYTKYTDGDAKGPGDTKVVCQ